jgi:hypothetical protein
VQQPGHANLRASPKFLDDELVASIGIASFDTANINKHKATKIGKLLIFTCRLNKLKEIFQLKHHQVNFYPYLCMILW